ncbi:MAG TPA: glucose-1-phosphate thymidylyltransferase [Micromonosporaceae bacterium]|nr:glucose-1-phosphate thymidylyltransferase [Micromonosporaceae bacterium]
MKALVLAGGAGTRLRPFSYSMPKQLMPIANKPVLVHIVETLREIAVKQIGIVVGTHADEIRAVLGDGSAFNVEISYIVQDAPRGLAHCVQIARGFLGDDDFVMYLGDNILPEGVAEVAEEFHRDRPAAQVVLHKVPDPQAFGVAEVDPSGWVTALVEKPKEPRSDLALIGVYFFTPAIHQAVAAIKPSARGELEITDAIQWLVSSGWKVRGHVYSGFWKDTGNVEDLLECNREVLDGLRSSIAGEFDRSTQFSGPVVLEAGAKVTRSRIVGPAIIGAGSVVEDSYVGPHTTVGRDCVLRQTSIDYSILLSGAKIHQVRAVYGSIIGRSAIVSASPGTGRHRLVIGDHTSLEVAG